MESEKKGHSEQQEGKSSAKLLQKLREQLNSSNASIRRQAAFNLSWLQEDGLEILKAVMYGNGPTKTKNAAAYGLRKMRGRMKKMALDVLKEGLEHSNSSTREACEHALELVGEIKKEPGRNRKRPRVRIKEIPARGRSQRRAFVPRTGTRSR